MAGSPAVRRSWRQPRRALALIAAAFAAFVLSGFLGRIHPAFDTIGQFRLHASAMLALLAVALVVLKRPGLGLGTLAVAALGLRSALSFMPLADAAANAAPGAPRYTLLQMNLRYDAPDRAQALSLIARSKPDVVTVQEVTAKWKTSLDRLRSAYPYQAYCTEAFRDGATAILSRRPFSETAPSGRRAVSSCDERNGFSLRTVDFNGLAVAVGSLHLRWPWPGRQWRMIDALQPTLADLDDPLVIAGDFNSAPWSASIDRFALASRTRILAGIGPTWISKLLPPVLARFVGLPIDNVLVSDGVEVLDVRRLEATTSDHLPVLVTFTMRFALPEEPDVRSASR